MAYAGAEKYLAVALESTFGVAGATKAYAKVTRYGVRGKPELKRLDEHLGQLGNLKVRRGKVRDTLSIRLRVEFDSCRLLRTQLLPLIIEPLLGQLRVHSHQPAQFSILLLLSSEEGNHFAQQSYLKHGRSWLLSRIFSGPFSLAATRFFRTRFRPANLADSANPDYPARQSEVRRSASASPAHLPAPECVAIRG
jgi:hypothetical protein